MWYLGIKCVAFGFSVEELVAVTGEMAWLAFEPGLCVLNERLDNPELGKFCAIQLELI